MRRRDLIAMLGGAVVAWPLAARAQQKAMPVIGFLSSRSPDESASVVAAFRRGLAETGYVEGQNLTVESRWAEGRYDRLPRLAVDLVDRHVAVIVAVGGEPSALAAKAATAKIPIVFAIGGDPVKLGLVTTLARPGGNVTGVTLLFSGLGGKRLEMIREVLPAVTVIALLINPSNPGADDSVREVEAAARVLRLEVHLLSAVAGQDFDTAFDALVQSRIGALIVDQDPFFLGQRDRLVALAARHAIPTMYFSREFVEAGGLISYGSSIAAGYQQVGVYTGKILKGAKPSELPATQPTKFELVINLKTAKALRVTIPPMLLGSADEVIE